MELLAGQMFKACRTVDRMIFLMDTKNPFLWTMCHALETKGSLINADINMSAITAIANTDKMS